jgi:hypothetical protein
LSSELVRSTDVVLPDTSVLVDFVRGEQTPELAMFLEFVGDRLQIALDVAREITRLANTDFPELRLLLMMREFKILRHRSVPHELQRKAQAALRASQCSGDHPDKNAGEVSTIYCALEDQRAGRRVLLLMDDRYGIALARHESIPVLRTEQLLGQMVAVGSLRFATGYKIFRGDRSKHDRPWARFVQIVESATRQLGQQ